MTTTQKRQVVQGSFPHGTPKFAATPPVAAAARRAVAPHLARSLEPHRVPGRRSEAPAAPAVQRFGGGEAFRLPADLARFNSAPGQPLPDPVRRQMESFFGTSFADVRVHVGHQASAIGALAFTHGADLYFAPGQYNPNTTHGQRLLGHELAHVVQQRAGRVRNPFATGVAVVQDRTLEAEADLLGRQAATHRPPARATPARHVRGGAIPRTAAIQPMRTRSSRGRKVEVTPLSPEDAYFLADYWEEITHYKLFRSGSDKFYALVDETHPIDENPAVEVTLGRRMLIMGNRVTILKSVGRYYVTDETPRSSTDRPKLIVRKEYQSGFGHGARYVIVEGAAFYGDAPFASGGMNLFRFLLDIGDLDGRYVLLDGANAELATQAYVYAENQLQTSDLTSVTSLSNLARDVLSAEATFEILPKFLQNLSINPSQHVFVVRTDTGIPGTFREDASTVMGVRGVVLACLLGLDNPDAPTQRWEFLHTRARRHGGASIGTDLSGATFNFVLGTEPANSVMTQYEESITRFSESLLTARRAIETELSILVDLFEAEFEWPYWTITPVFVGCAQWFRMRSTSELGVFLHSGYMQYRWQAHHWDETARNAQGTVCRELRRRVAVKRFLSTGESEPIYTNRRAVYGRGEDLLVKNWLRADAPSSSPYFSFRVASAALVPAGGRHAPIAHAPTTKPPPVEPLFSL